MYILALKTYAKGRTSHAQRLIAVLSKTLVKTVKIRMASQDPR